MKNHNLLIGCGCERRPCPRCNRHRKRRVLRADRRVSRRELAEALGVHYQTVGYLERGEYAPSLHLALRIARYFDVPVESVFSLEEFPRLS